LLVHVKGVSSDNGLKWVRSRISFLGVFNGPHEKCLVPLKRELIHGVNHVHVEKHEVKGGGLLSDGSEVFTRVVNFLHGLLKTFLRALGFLRFFLSSVQSVDKLNIFEERSLLVLERR
jgi:hypothetical protein